MQFGNHWSEQTYYQYNVFITALTVTHIKDPEETEGHPNCLQAATMWLLFTGYQFI